MTESEVSLPHLPISLISFSRYCRSPYNSPRSCLIVFSLPTSCGDVVLFNCCTAGWPYAFALRLIFFCKWNNKKLVPMYGCHEIVVKLYCCHYDNYWLKTQTLFRDENILFSKQNNGIVLVVNPIAWLCQCNICVPWPLSKYRYQ